MKLPDKVKIVEVGPRDGLQNEITSITTEIKVELIERLANAGVKFIEAAAFVSPRWVPKMADSGEVMNRVNRQSNVVYSALTPNLKGFYAALEAKVDEVAIFAAASETFSERNINCSIDESLQRFNQVTEAAKRARLPVRGYISCVLGCPYEGPISVDAVVSVARSLEQIGCHEISLGDTIGTGTPAEAQSLIKGVSKVIPIERIAVHFHDTYGQALANILASMEIGVSVIDSSISGLGGCPYAKGASGNVASEDVLYMLHGLGIQTGIDLNVMIETASFISKTLGRSSDSKVTRAKIEA
ncbi:MAG: hydroxymethylglutaryl-CoA lyase [Magnetovibrio sp.]|nr:hydroxymethylglutaryl-CoA lyase [Magnetovibrio sp.]|tara:strand:+ start:169 stop:1068 length:900 start_codon:yes stop_codon:yes gene_type:complete